MLRVRDQLARLPWSHRITIADNASTDGTAVLARRLAHTHDDVRVVHLAEKGRGRALKKVWADSDADVLVYMDVDLSTDLNALLPLVAPLISGHSDLAIGSRLRPRLAGGPRAEARGDLARLQPAGPGRAADPVLRRAVRVQGDPRGTWRARCCRWSRTTRGSSTPSCWCSPSAPGCGSTRCRWTGSTTRTAGSTSRGRRTTTCAASCASAATCSRAGYRSPRSPSGSAGRPPTRAPGGSGCRWRCSRLVGIASTVAYAVLYLLLRGWTGAWTANLLALLLTAIGNTAANRRLTFGVRGRRDVLRHQVQGLLVFGDRAGGDQRRAVGGARARAAATAASRSRC